MNDVAIAFDSVTTNPASYRHGRPRLLLVRDDAGSGSPVGEQAAPSADEPETVSDWSRVHARIAELGAARAHHERELCRSLRSRFGVPTRAFGARHPCTRWLLAAERLGVHARAGYASLREYAGRVVGLSGRQTEERLRVGRALGELPGLDRTLASAELCFSVVRELTRVAQPETEGEWLDWARGKTTRQVEQAVASRRPGDGPRDSADPSRLTHRLAFQVRAETMALFRDLQATVRRDLGGEVDDDGLLYEIARRALGGPTDAGRASYQVALTRCEVCGRASIEAAGQSHPVDPAVVEMAACDSQQLGTVGGVGVGQPRGNDSGDCAASPHAGADEGTRAADPEAARPIPASPHVGAKGAPAPRGRAAQTIPPAVRRAVMRRDRQRCSVPGCTNHRFLDVHHLHPLAEGGNHDPERLVVLCGSHHRAVHAGTLHIDGNTTDGFSLRHADGSPYGEALRPAAVDLAAQTYGTLRHLGFRHARARALVDTAAQAGVPDTREQFVGAALRAS
ncbi:MAG: hypothetical protein JRI68_15055 [Deltaproteobacteria bacterium]|nr:hypothetical protein [Deltaproteobacteria bacterium]